jgi:hypothetical protein
MTFQARHHVEVVRRDEIHSEYRENAYAHIENVRAALEKVPIEFRADAVFELNTWEDRDDLPAYSMTISYERPPTEAEIAEQMAEDRRRLAEDIEWIQRRASEILKQAQESGYTFADGDWPFKTDLPNAAALDDS